MFVETRIEKSPLLVGQRNLIGCARIGSDAIPQFLNQLETSGNIKSINSAFEIIATRYCSITRAHRALKSVPRVDQPSTECSPTLL